MAYRSLWPLVEGADDQRFFDRVLRPVFQGRYADVRPAWKYAQQKNEKIRNFLRSIRQMGADCLFLADADASPCPADKKQRIVERFPHELPGDRVVIVVREIESWYLAGTGGEMLGELKLQPNLDADEFTKERLHQHAPPRFRGSRVDFLVEMLKQYSLPQAVLRSRSLRYLMEKHGKGVAKE